jgi:general secretion pathway protein D
MRVPLKTLGRCTLPAALLAALLSGCFAPPLRVPAPGHVMSNTKDGAEQSSVSPVPQTSAGATARANTSYVGTGQLTSNPSAQTATAARPSTQNGIQLAFTDVDISQVAGSVLGEALGLDYAIDPSVKGTMSLRSSHPLSQEELLPALESALRIQDLALVKVKDSYHVVPLKDAPRRVSSINPPSDRNQPGFAIEIVSLQFTSPVEMEKVLQPFAPPGGVMKVDEARNLLILAGTSQELATMLDVVRTFDVDWLAGMSYGFFSLNYVDAKTVETELSAIFADPKSPLAGVIRLVPLPRLNTILVITPQPKYLQSVETWIKRLDIGGTSAGRRIYVYDVQNGRAEDLARSLNHILSLPSGMDDSTTMSRGFSSTSPGAQFSFGGGLGVGSGSGSGVGGGSSFGGASNLSAGPGLGASWSGGGQQPGYSSSSSVGSNGYPTGSGKAGDLRIVANNDSNSLLILATPAEFSVIEAALQRLDTPSRQVLIEASLAEVTLTDELRYGVQWSFNGKNGPVTLSDTGKITQSFPGLSFLFTGSTNISAVLNALESVTKVRVISSPKLVTLNNHEAQLQIGDQVPITTQSAISTSTSGAPIVNSVAMRDTGVILQVTPRVNKNGLVQLDISQELSNSVPTTTSNIDSPTIQERRFSTTVEVKNGDTVALGGLITDNVTKSRSGVPYLSKIPVLGGLFRDTDDTRTRTELILLITPRVMRDDQEFQEVMDDLRNEFQTLKKLFKEPAPAKR